MITPADLFYYRVKEFVGNYDGDTIDFIVDLGFHTFKQIRVRLYGIDTPELRGEDKEAGIIARDYVNSCLTSANEILVRTYKDKTGKYGRWLATVYYDGICLNDDLVAHSMAKRYED